VSSLYDYKKVELRYNLMKKLRKENNVTALVKSLRQDLFKNMGGIANP
jgi:hypothetical protein